MKQENPTKQ